MTNPLCTAGRRRLLGCGILSFGLAFAASSGALAQERPGAVYVMTNQATGNAITAFARAANGALTPHGTFSTGGLGFGSGTDPLGSQGALALSAEGHFLYAVNAGSNDISVMAATRRGLTLVGKVAAGGTEPVSLALHKNLLYVLNAGGTPNISGFTIRRDGMLVGLQGSQQPLTGGTSAAPAAIAFSPDGNFLVVSEKGTNLIDTYAVLGTGLPSAPLSNSSQGVTPFGLAFALSGTLVTSEADGGVAGAGSASSYTLSPTGSLVVSSGSVADTQTAPCWIVITDDGRLAFASNTASATISSYTLAANGDLALAKAIAGNTPAGGAPIDMALSSYDRFLYVINSAQGSVSAFAVGADGSLASLPGVTGLPLSAQGIVAQ